MQIAPTPVLKARVPTLPELLARVPLPAEGWKRIEAGLPEPLQHILSLRRRLPALPRPSTRQIFAAVVPAGLALGWLASVAVDPEIAQRGGKPYAEVVTDGVRVELPRLAFEDSFPVDPAPFGYGNAPQADYLAGGIAEAGDAADGAEAQQAALVADGEELGAGQPAPDDAPQPAAPPKAAIQVVPQDTPL